MKTFPNPRGNEWIDKYNSLVSEVKAREEYYKAYRRTQPKRDDKKKSYDKWHPSYHPKQVF